MKFWEEVHCKLDFKHARKLTAFYSRSFYVSASVLPRDERWATFAVYAFCRYCDNLIDTPRERTSEELTEELDVLAQELVTSYRTGESEHPVVRPFIVAARHYSIPIEYPLDLIKGVQMDITHKHYDTFSELSVFCYRVAAVVGLMMTHVLGYKHDSAFDYAAQMGMAMQLTNILRDISEDKDRGRVYLPRDEMKKFGVKVEDIMSEYMTPQLRELMKFQIERAYQYYANAQAGVALLPANTQFAIYSASRIYRGILHRIELRDYNPFLGRVFVPQRTKVGILLREVLRSKALSLQERLHVFPPVG